MSATMTAAQPNAATIASVEARELENITRYLGATRTHSAPYRGDVDDLVSLRAEPLTGELILTTTNSYAVQRVVVADALTGTTADTPWSMTVSGPAWRDVAADVRRTGGPRYGVLIAPSADRSELIASGHHLPAVAVPSSRHPSIIDTIAGELTADALPAEGTMIDPRLLAPMLAKLPKNVIVRIGATRRAGHHALHLRAEPYTGGQVVYAGLVMPRNGDPLDGPVLPR